MISETDGWELAKQLHTNSDTSSDTQPLQTNFQGAIVCIYNIYVCGWNSSLVFTVGRNGNIQGNDALMGMQ